MTGDPQFSGLLRSSAEGDQRRAKVDQSVLAEFHRGLDTVDIARLLGITESRAYAALARRSDRRAAV